MYRLQRKITILSDLKRYRNRQLIGIVIFKCTHAQYCIVSHHLFANGKNEFVDGIQFKFVDSIHFVFAHQCSFCLQSTDVKATSVVSMCNATGFIAFACFEGFSH